MERPHYKGAVDTPSVLLLARDDTRAASAALDGEYDYVTLSASAVNTTPEPLLDAACLIVDDECPTVDTFEVLEWVRDTAPDLPCILLADHNEQNTRDVIAGGVTDYVRTDTADWANELARSVQSAVERYQRLRAVKDREAMFRALTEYSADAIAVFDSDATQRYATPSFEQLTERSLGEGEQLFELVNSNDRQRFEREFDNLLQDPETTTVSVECRFQHATEVTRMYEVTLTDRCSDDTLHGIVVTVRDITEHVHLQTELDDVLGRVTDAFFAVDDDWQFTYANDRAEELLNRTKEELLSNEVWEMFPEAVGSTFYEEYHRAVETQEPVTFEEYYPPLETWFSVRAYPSKTGLSIYFRDVTERKEREQQLTAMNHFNEVFQEINQRIVHTSNRDEIAQLVCDRLVELDMYEAAWIGEIESTNEIGTPRAKAGLDDVTKIIDAADGSEQRRGPVREAAVSGKPVVVQDVSNESSNEQWLDKLLDNGYQSFAAIPLIHRNTVYGVLSIYSGNKNAFNTHERSILTQLGEVVGHSINAIERKEALLSDSVVEIKFQIADKNNFFVHASAELSTEITLKGVVPQPDGGHLTYITVGKNGADRFPELAEQSTQIEHVRLVSDYGDGALFETTYNRPSVTWTLSEYGAKIQSVSAINGVATVTADIPLSMNVNTLVGTLRQTFDDVEFVAQRLQERPMQTEREFWETIESQLTERQHATIEAAYHAGYFDWPRTSNGEEIAESMGVSLPTFSQHLRAGERKLFSSLIDDSG